MAPPYTHTLTLLLDFDGVLHPPDAGPRADDLRVIPPVLDPRVFCQVPVLEQAVQEVEANGIRVSIHLTTSWRTVLPLGACRSYLGNYLSERTTHVVPRLDLGSSRAEEVFAHLTQCALLDQPWLCLDDNPSLYWDLLDSDEFCNRLLIIDHPDVMTAEYGRKFVTLVLQQCSMEMDKRE
ncbi:MAG: HAD domain-containing protein [Proteobacteria bacterium]|nr:HAD domain-containing protein [Pseudomonadota bacterium]